MVQPYLSGIEDDGETALVYLRGMFSHAVRKGPVLTGPATVSRLRPLRGRADGRRHYYPGSCREI
jgi:hypothetical protein